MGIPIRELRPRDRGAYYSDTIVFRIRDNKPFIVRGFNEEDDLLQILPADNSHSNVSNISVDDLQENFIIHRPRLGWRNAGIGCLFATSSPGRGYKKGYVYSDIRCVSPIYQHTSSLLEKAHRDFHVKMETIDDDKALQEHRKYMERIDRALSSMQELAPQTTTYLKAYPAPFVHKSDVQGLLSGNYLGVAITSNWAVIQLPKNSKNRASIFYQDTVVGSMDLTNGNVSFFSGCSELKSAWERVR